jgi:N-acetylglutamate synthase-like GNAT family acetyltransferase
LQGGFEAANFLKICQTIEYHLLVLPQNTRCPDIGASLVRHAITQVRDAGIEGFYAVEKFLRTWRESMVNCLGRI